MAAAGSPLQVIAQPMALSPSSCATGTRLPQHTATFPPVFKCAAAHALHSENTAERREKERKKERVSTTNGQSACYSPPSAARSQLVSPLASSLEPSTSSAGVALSTAPHTSAAVYVPASALPFPRTSSVRRVTCAVCIIHMRHLYVESVRKQSMRTLHICQTSTYR